MKTNNLEILIVDDNAAFVKSFEMLLNSVLGTRIKVLDSAFNGLEAIDLVREKNGYDYIFMDVNMPTLNGIDASKIINNEYSKRTKIIAISFNDDFQTIKDMVFSGATSYINKAKITFEVISNIFDKDNSYSTRPNYY